MTDNTILSQLRDHLGEERSTNMFDVLEPALIQQARDRVRKIENLVIAEGEKIDGVDERLTLADERESIIETLSDISKLREEKLIMMAQHPEVFRPLNRWQPSEAKLLQDVRTAILIYRKAVR